MKPFLRRESIVAVLLTSAVAVVIILWATSYWYSIIFGVTRSRDNWQERHESFWGIYAQRGQVGIAKSRRRILHSPYSAPREWDVDHELILLAHGTIGTPWMSLQGRTEPDTFLGHLGFEVVNSTAMPGTGYVRTDHALLVPWWTVFIVALTIALHWTFFRERRLHWPRVGRCPACGYDLRQSPDRCPECGHEVGSIPQ
jgi:hypothetical protein